MPKVKCCGVGLPCHLSNGCHVAGECPRCRLDLEEQLLPKYTTRLRDITNEIRANEDKIQRVKRIIYLKNRQLKDAVLADIADFELGVRERLQHPAHEYRSFE